MDFRAAVIFLAVVALFLGSSEGKNTLNVDYIYPSAQSWTIIQNFTTNSIYATTADLNTFNIQPAGGVSVATGGPVSFAASFVNFNAANNANLTGSSINFLSSENFAIQATSLTTSANSNYSIQTLGGPINLHSSSISLQSDLQFINSEGPVNFVSTSGQINLIADEAALVQGLNTFLNGNNRLSVSSLNDLNLNAGSQFVANAGVIEFYSPNNVSLSTSINDINLFAGNGLLFTSFNVYFTGNGGVEFTSADAEIYLLATQQLNSNAQTVEVQADADAIFQSSGPVSVSAKTVNLNMDGSFIIDSTSLSLATGNATFTAANVAFSTNSNLNVAIQGSASSGGSSSSSTNSAVVSGSSVALAANNIATSSGSLTVSTQTGDIILKSDEYGTINFDFAGATSSLSAPLIAFDSGIINWQVNNDFSIEANTINFVVDRHLDAGISFNSFVNILGAGSHIFEAESFFQTSSQGATYSASNSILVASGQETNAIQFTTTTLSVTSSSNIVGDALEGYISLNSLGASNNITGSSNLFFGSPNQPSYSIRIASHEHDLNSNTFQSTSSGNIDFNTNQFTLDASINTTFTASRNISLATLSDSIELTASVLTENAVDIVFAGGEQVNIAPSGTFQVTGSFDYLNRDYAGGGTLLSASNFISLQASSTFQWDVVEQGSFSLTTSDAELTVANNAVFQSNYISNDPSGSNVIAANTANFLFNTLDQGYFLLIGENTITFNFVHGNNFINSNGNVYFSTGNSAAITAGADATFSAYNDFRTFGDDSNIASTGGSINYVSGNNFNLETYQLFAFLATNNFNSQSTMDTNILGGKQNNLGIFIQSNNNFLIGNGNLAYFYTPYVLSSNSMSSASTTVSLTSSLNINAQAFTADIQTPFFIQGGNILAIYGHENAALKAAGSIAFDGYGSNSTLNFDSGHLNVEAGTNINLSALGFSVAAGQTSQLIMSAFNGDLIFKDAVSFDISSGFRYNSSANGIYYTANQGINVVNYDSFSSIDIIERFGSLNFTAFNQNSFQSANQTLYAADNLFFETYTGVSQGISITSSGSVFDPVYGKYVGLSVHSQSGEIFFDVPLGQYYVAAGNALSFNQQTSIFTSNSYLSYTTSAGNITLAGGLNATFVTNQGDVLINTNTGNIEIGSTTTFTQNSTLGAVSFTSTNSNASNAIEFSSNNGGINITANSNQNINYNSGSNTTVQSGYATNITAATFATFQALSGQFNVISGDEFDYAVDNGNLVFTANNNITLYTEGQYGVNITSGFDGIWTANTGNISIVAQSRGELRTTSGNALFQTISPNGNISVTSGASIRVQADATDNSPGSSVGTDGIYVNANNINIKTVNDISLDNEGIFTVGFTTTPIVTVAAGGDLLNPGFTAISYGGIGITSQQDFNINSADQFLVYAVDTMKMQTNGQIQVVSAGTSTEGGDVKFIADGDFSINANLVNVVGTQAFTLSGGEILNIQSVHNNVNLNSATDIIANVNGTLGLDAATWSLVSDNFDFFAAGDISVTTLTGGILVDGQTGLSFVSNNDISFYTLGANAPLSFQTTENNSPITIQANDTTSNVGFIAQLNSVAFTSSDGIFINAFEGVALTALDILSNDNVDQGNVIITAQDDITATANGILSFEAANGIYSSTTNPNGASISLTADGQFLASAYSDILFYSSARDITISGPEANLPISISTTPGNSGSVVFESTRNLLLNVENSANFNYNILGDGLFTTARTFTVNAGNQLTIATNGTQGNLDIFSNKGGVSFTVDKGININAELASITATKAVSFIFEDNTASSGSNFISISDSSPTQLSTFSVPNNNLYAYATDANLNLNSFIAGNLLNVTALIGGININTPSVARVISGGTATFLSSQGTISLAVNNPFTQTVITSTGNLGNIAVYGSNSVQVNALDISFVASSPSQALISVQDFGGSVTFNSNANNIPSQNSNENGFGILITSSHPLGNINFLCADYLIGNINYQAAGTFAGYSFEDFTFENQDDDDTNTIGSFEISSSASASFVGRQVVLTENGFGNIVVNTPSTGVARFIAAGTISTTTNNVFEMNGNTQTTFNAGSDVYIGAGADINFSGFTSNVIQAASILLGGQSTAAFTGGNTITITSNFGLNFPSLEVEMVLSSQKSISFLSQAINFNLLTPSGERGDLYIPDSSTLIIPVQTVLTCSVGNQFFLYQNAAPKICICVPPGPTAVCF